jgi:hypothetical protein
MGMRRSKSFQIKKINGGNLSKSLAKLAKNEREGFNPLISRKTVQ